MNLSYLYTVLAAGIAMMFADWLFSGVIAHKQYNVYPEVWRSSPGGSEGKKIALSNLLNFFSALFFAVLCGHLNLHRFWYTGHVALGIWLIGPLPLLVSNGIWMKLTPTVTAAHAFGWLAKLLLAAAAVTLLLH